MKSVLRSIKPYWFYLICEGIKKIEVGKTAPTAECWDKITYLYCSKDMKSFNRIPKEHREKYRKYLGKVGARFVCDKVDKIVLTARGYTINNDIAYTNKVARESCLYFDDLQKYLGKNVGYAWHISELKIYDKPKELSEFKKVCLNGKCSDCIYEECKITRPPQSWQYVEEL